MESEYKLGISFFAGTIFLYLVMLYLLSTQDSAERIVKACDTVGIYMLKNGKTINCKVLKLEKE